MKMTNVEIYEQPGLFDPEQSKWIATATFKHEGHTIRVELNERDVGLIEQLIAPKLQALSDAILEVV